MARPAYSADERQRIEQSIRDSALALFGRDGYRSVSMRAIAGELNWSAPALYRYYPSKETLVAAIRAEGFVELQEILSSIRQADLAPISAVRAALEAYLQFAMEKSDLYRLMYELDQAELDGQAQVGANRQQAFAEAERLAARVLEESRISGDSNQIAHLFWIGAHGLAALAVAHQLDLGQDYQALVDPVLQMILHGALPSQQTPTEQSGG